MKLLTHPKSNTKISKNIALGYYTAPLHLAPYNLSGYQVCPMASKGCAAACLNTAGRGIYQKVQDARIRKTKMFFNQRKEFFNILCKDIESLQKKAKSLSLHPAIRLNATSDISWEVFELPNTTKNIFETFPDIQFYDYFKTIGRLKKDLPKNYYLTFSMSETNEKECEEAYFKGFNVSVVYKYGNNTLPYVSNIGEIKQRNVIDGDMHDCRFLDPKSVIVGLRAKGRAKKDVSGFVKFV